MSHEFDNKKAWMVIKWVLAGAIIGLFTSSAICYTQPKMFESRALLAVKEAPGRTVPLAPCHAKQAIRLISDLIPWDAENFDLFKITCENTRIKSKNGIVEISVRTWNRESSCDIAIELAWLFRSMDEEASLQHEVSAPKRPSEDTLALIEKRRDIERLMDEEARNLTGALSFRVIPSLRTNQSPGASELWESESFQRQWTFHRKITEEIAGEPRSSLPVPEFVEYPAVSDFPVSPNVSLYQQSGLLSGVAVGLLIGMRKSRRMIPSSQSQPKNTSVSPAITKNAPPPLPGSLERISKTHDIEDEW